MSGASTKYRMRACVQRNNIGHTCTYVCSAVCLLADDDSGGTKTAVLCAFDNLSSVPICVIIVRVNCAREVNFPPPAVVIFM